MSENGTESVTEATPVRTVHPAVRFLAVGLSAAAALALLIFFQGMRASAMQREAFARGIDGLASAMAQPIIESNSRVYENRRDRLQKTVEGIRAAGGYESVTVADAQGLVIATTDLKFRGQTLKELAEGKQKTRVENVNGVLVAISGVFTEGGAQVGGLRVEVRL
jgi:hypothetical protein